MYNPPSNKDLLDAVPAKFKNDNSFCKEALSRSTYMVESNRARLFPDSIPVSKLNQTINDNKQNIKNNVNKSGNDFIKIKVNKNNVINKKPSSYKNIPNFHAHIDNVKDIFNSKEYNNIKEQKITQKPNKNSFSDVSSSARKVIQERYNQGN
jgi:predicted S18 family serine protease